MSLFVALLGGRKRADAVLFDGEELWGRGINSRRMCWLGQMKAFHEVLKPRLGA